MAPPCAENNILHAIGHLIGVDELSFDDDGLCELELADEIPVALSDDPTNQRILILAEVGRISDPDKEFLHSITGWNMHRITQPRPWIAWDAEDSRLVIGEEIAHGESAHIAEKKFEAFMESLLQCRGFLEGGPISAPSAVSHTLLTDWLRRC